MAQMLTKVGWMGVVLVGVLNLHGMDGGSVTSADDVRSICSAGSVDATPEVTPSTSPVAGQGFLRSPAALKLMEKLSGRYTGPLSPMPVVALTDTPRQDFYTRDGRLVSVSLPRSGR